MHLEIERKFRVASDAWRDGTSGVPIRQGYLTGEGEPTVRVRIAGEAAFLTIKGPTVDASRWEFEYPIPTVDAEAILELCDRSVVKTRHRVVHGAHTWEVDVFEGTNAPLIVAEVELAARHEPLDIPAWVGREVTGEPRYYNSRLASEPYSEWGDPAADPG